MELATLAAQAAAVLLPLLRKAVEGSATEAGRKTTEGAVGLLQALRSRLSGAEKNALDTAADQDDERATAQVAGILAHEMDKDPGFITLVDRSVSTGHVSNSVINTGDNVTIRR